MPTIAKIGRPTLTSHVRLVAVPAALDGLVGQGRVVENDGNAARWEWAGESSEFHVRSVMTGECDGFCWYEITLTPKKPLPLHSLRLEIPCVAATAQYLHTANFTWDRLSQGLKEYGGRRLMRSCLTYGLGMRNEDWLGAVSRFGFDAASLDVSAPWQELVPALKKSRVGTGRAASYHLS